MVFWVLALSTFTGFFCFKFYFLLHCAEPQLQPQPADRSQAVQQITLALISALPVAVNSALEERGSDSIPGAGDASKPKVTPVDIAAGRELWLKQASEYDKLTCPPFNGKQALLSTSQPAEATVLAQIEQAKRHLANASKQAASAVRAAHRKHLYATGAKLTADAKAAAIAATAAAPGQLAAIAWDGGVTLGATFFAQGPSSEPDVQRAGNVLADMAHNMVPWVKVQVS